MPTTIELVRSVTGKNGVILVEGTIRDFPEEIALHLIERGVGRPVAQRDPEGYKEPAELAPPTEAPSIPVPKYSIGDRVAFLFRDSRTTKEGVVEDLLFNAAAKWWYRIDDDGKTMWAGESHITGRTGT